MNQLKLLILILVLLAGGLAYWKAEGKVIDDIQFDVDAEILSAMWLIRIDKDCFLYIEAKGEDSKIGLVKCPDAI